MLGADRDLPALMIDPVLARPKQFRDGHNLIAHRRQVVNDWFQRSCRVQAVVVEQNDRTGVDTRHNPPRFLCAKSANPKITLHWICVITKLGSDLSPCFEYSRMAAKQARLLAYFLICSWTVSNLRLFALQSFKCG